MQEANEDLRARLQANLDVAAGLCRLGFTYGEQVTTLTTETMHKWVHQADQDPKVLLQGDVAGFTAASGRIAVDHWSALLVHAGISEGVPGGAPEALAVRSGQEKPDRNVITGSYP